MGTAARKSERDEVINLRASRSQKALIDKAADALGRTRSEFMLDSACREAESVLLDRRYFTLSSDAFARFIKALDAPSPKNERLARLLKTRPPWER
jgi:uncharacterized protein (DUF1778 family)